MFFSSFQLLPMRQLFLKIFDLLGREVTTLMNGKEEPGSHIVEWKGLSGTGVSVASGVYFSRMTTENLALTKKLVLVR